MDDDSFIFEVNEQFHQKKIDYKLAQDLLYDMTNRKKRFQVFIALYDATLKNNPTIAAKVFREAYCSSDNIHNQIKNSKFPFNLKLFLKSIQTQGVNFIELMNDDEREFYNSLPSQIRIYRGLCEAEYKSRDFGISWSITENEAEQYAYFHQNDVEDGKGRLLYLDICKEDIFTVFSVHTYDKVMHEIIYISK